MEYPSSQEQASFSIDQIARNVEAEIKENAQKGAGSRAFNRKWDLAPTWLVS